MLHRHTNWTAASPAHSRAYLSVTVNTEGWLAAVVPDLTTRERVRAAMATVAVWGVVTFSVTSSGWLATATMVGSGGVPSTTGGDQLEVALPVAVVAVTVTM